MIITFYNTKSDARKLEKILENPFEMIGDIKSDFEIDNFTLRIKSISVFNYNYCFISDFNHYYFVNSIEYIGKNTYNIRLKIDVLMSFKNEIKKITATQVKGDKVNLFFDTVNYASDNRMNRKKYNFNNSFNTKGSNILIGVSSVEGV